MIDNRTDVLNLPLPDAGNSLNDDVGRIVDALRLIDAAVATKATPADVQAAVADILDAAPGTLNTLNELAAALNDDPNFAATVASQLALKANQADTTALLLTKQDAFPVVLVASTSQAASADTHYLLTNVAATTVTLPESPAEGAAVWITPANSLQTNVVARNGKTIMGLAENLTLDLPNKTVGLRYLNASWRIVQ